MIEQYERDILDHVENVMKFFYDDENRKIKAIRYTSQGEAADIFTYKHDKLSSHTDPQGAITHFIHDETYVNDLGQKVLQKTTIDPIGNTTIEQEDACGKQVLQEKKDSNGTTVSKETYRYDRSGNKIKRISAVYHKNIKIKDIEVSWEYDVLGRITREIEAGCKITAFKYDSRGHLKEKILPNGIRLQYFYDGADRLLRLESSDGSINYEYRYEKGPDPVLIFDHVHHTTTMRAYNLFGEIIHETNPANFCLNWNYDIQGRCTQLTLPDQSSIQYTFSGAHLNAVTRYSRYGKFFYQHKYCTFDPNGYISEEELINNLGYRHTTHDLLERPISQTSSWLKQSISYGPSGLVTSIDNSFFGEKYYSYDALNQMIEDGDKKYFFDSLGNSTEHEIDNRNRLLSTKDSSFIYDNNGNPQERIFPNETIKYSYDALGRLTEILKSTRKICYFYDPFSRLYAKETFIYGQNGWEKEGKLYYLQSQDGEIGTIDENGNIMELKVIGIGIKGEIGAAIAIESGDEVYAPLHDFMGNIIALIASGGRIQETYEIDAFGKEELKSNACHCPWRFCSKRSEEGFVYFGLRFYDPSIGRWHTPDPAGFQDGSNLYIYVLNSPLNRLDLFGLSSDPYHVPVFMIPIKDLPHSNALLKHRSLENGVYIDYLVSCGYWHKLEFTQEEEKAGEFNLMNRLSDLHSGKSPTIDLVTFENGINVTYEDFDEACCSIVNRLPGTLFLGRYNETAGALKDGMRATIEISGIETPKVCGTRQFMIACAEGIHKISPTTMENVAALWLHCAHSEAGILQRRGIEGMTPDQKALMHQHLIAYALAPGMPMPKSYAYESVNIYSKQDFITGIFGASDIPAMIAQGFVGKRGANSYCRNSNCDIRFVPCISKWSERSMYFADHAFLGGTYQAEIKKWISIYEDKFSFNNGTNR